MANNLQYGLSESMNVWLQEARKTLQLAFPIMLSQVSQNLIQVIDTAMIGRVGVVPLAAAAFASNMFIVPLVFCYGISSAVSVLAANAFGAGDSKRADRVLRCGLVVSMVAGLLIALGMQMMRGMLHQLGQPEAVSIEAEPYFVLLGWSIAPVLLGSSLKNYSEANSRPWVPFTSMVLLLVLNVFFNWVFIYGHFGAPAMGLVGAGIGTLLARCLATLYLAMWIGWGRSWPFHWISRDWLALRWGDFRNLLSIGLPSAVQGVSEVSAFMLASIMIGWLGDAPLAAHQIAINVASMTFMVTLGLSFSSTVRISQKFGQRDYRGVRIVGSGVCLMAVVFMVVCMVGILMLRGWIPGLFVTDAEVIRLAALYLVLVGMFQVFDGIQVTMIGSLRGMQDVRVPMWIQIGIYFGVSLPLAYVLAFPLGMEGAGIWTGLLVGLALCAVVSSMRFHVLTRRHIRMIS